MNVPLPESLMRMETRVLLNPAFTAEVDEWCKTELTGAFSIKYVPLSDRLVYENAFEIIFANDTDAVLFKMRWL